MNVAKLFRILSGARASRRRDHRVRAATRFRKGSPIMIQHEWEPRMRRRCENCAYLKRAKGNGAALCARPNRRTRFVLLRSVCVHHERPRLPEGPPLTSEQAAALDASMGVDRSRVIALPLDVWRDPWLSAERYS